MSKRYIPDYKEADKFFRSYNPKRLTEKDAERLGQGPDLDLISLDLDLNPNFGEKNEFFRIKKGDYVEFKPSESHELKSLKALGLPNLFVVTNVILEDGKRMLAIKNEKDSKYKKRLLEDNFEEVTK